MIINPIFVYLSLFYSFSHFLSPLLRICDLSHACYMSGYCETHVTSLYSVLPFFCKGAVILPLRQSLLQPYTKLLAVSEKAVC